MSITNLAGTKWELPNVFTCSQLGAKNIDVRFDFGSYLFNMSMIVFEESQVVFKYSQSENTPRVEGKPKDNYAWTIYSGPNVKTPSVPPSNPPLVEIFGGEDATDSDVIDWFLTNATQIVDPPATEPFLSKTGLAKVWQNIQTYLNKKGAFVLDTSAPCSYNELQEAINAPNVILVKHDGGVYPFVEKWETDEGNKRYVNIASLQRQGADKGAIYFFLEAIIGDLDSPMVYSSNYVQPTGKPYTDSITGNLSNLDTTEKTNLVGAVNEVSGKVGFHVAVNQERWVGTYTDENGVVYQVYSKQIYIPALPDTPGITAYEHGIDNIKQILDIYGSTTDGFVLNAPRQTVTDNITIYQASRSASNKTFSIEVGKDRSSKKAYVTVIYAKNN